MYKIQIEAGTRTPCWETHCPSGTWAWSFHDRLDLQNEGHSEKRHIRELEKKNFFEGIWKESAKPGLISRCLPKAMAPKWKNWFLREELKNGGSSLELKNSRTSSLWLSTSECPVRRWNPTWAWSSRFYSTLKGRFSHPEERNWGCQTCIYDGQWLHWARLYMTAGSWRASCHQKLCGASTCHLDLVSSSMGTKDQTPYRVGKPDYQQRPLINYFLSTNVTTYQCPGQSLPASIRRK